MRLFPMLFVGLAAALPAQQASPFQCVPKDSMLVLSCAGPAQWRSMFGDTRVATLFRGPVLGKLVDTAGQQFDALIEQAKDAPFDLAAVRDGAIAYSGRLILAANVDLSSLATAMQNDEPPAWSVAWVLTPDGHTDLAAMVEQIGKLAEASGQEFKDMQVGEQRLRVMVDPHEPMQVATPTLIGGNVVMLMGSDLEHQAAAYLDATRPRYDGSAMQKSAFALHLEASAAVQALIDAVSKQGEAQGMPVDMGGIIADLGLGALQNLSMRVGADGKYMVTDVEVGLAAGHRGMFEIYGKPSAMRPKLLDYVPAGADAFSATQLDLGAIYRTMSGIWDSMGPMVPMTREDFEQQFAENCKVRLREDLLDLLGSELIYVGDQTAQAEAMADEPQGPAAAMAMFAGSCYGVQLLDGKKFATSIAAILRANGLHAAQKTEDYQGHKVNRLHLGPFEIEYAITDDLLLLALGSDEASRKSLRGILDEAAARRDGKPTAELPAAVKERLAAMPAGWSGVTSQSMSQLISVMHLVMKQASERGEADAEDLAPVREVLQALPGELHRVGLEHMVSTSYVTERGIKAQMRW